MKARELPPPVQTVGSLADRWALSVTRGPIVSCRALTRSFGPHSTTLNAINSMQLHKCATFFLLPNTLFYLRLICPGSECMTQWRPQSIMGIDQQQEKGGRPKEETSVSSRDVFTRGKQIFNQSRLLLLDVSYTFLLLHLSLFTLLFLLFLLLVLDPLTQVEKFNTLTRGLGLHLQTHTHSKSNVTSSTFTSA